MNCRAPIHGVFRFFHIIFAIYSRLNCPDIPVATAGGRRWPASTCRITEQVDTDLNFRLSRTAFRSSRRTPKSGTDGFHDRINRQHDDIGLAASSSGLTMSLYLGRVLDTTFARVRGDGPGVVGARDSGWRIGGLVMENVNRESDNRNLLRFDDIVGRSERGPRPAVTALDDTRTGTEAEDLANRLRSRVVGQDEAIQHIVRTYQTYLAGLFQLAGRSEISSSSVRRVQARRGSRRPRPSACSGIRARSLRSTALSSSIATRSPS